MDRVSDYESAGWEFESLHPHHEKGHAEAWPFSWLKRRDSNSKEREREEEKPGGLFRSERSEPTEKGGEGRRMGRDPSAQISSPSPQKRRRSPAGTQQFHAEPKAKK